jgi:hypothetical protein
MNWSYRAFSRKSPEKFPLRLKKQSPYAIICNCVGLFLRIRKESDKWAKISKVCRAKHASIKATMDRYVHVTDESLANAVRLFQQTTPPVTKKGVERA